MNSKRRDRDIRVAHYIIWMVVLAFLYGCDQEKGPLALGEVSKTSVSSEEGNSECKAPKKLAYIVSDNRIPYWKIMENGILDEARKRGYEVKVYSAHNDKKRELEWIAKAFQENVEGIILSPTDSSACATVLKLAHGEHIPVVVSDIGSESRDYVAYVSSDNERGGYEVGRALAVDLRRHGWQNGMVGIVSIPQKRGNGQKRTQGFLRALEENGIRNIRIVQQRTFTYEETYRYTLDLIESFPQLRAIWLQGSNQYQAALDAIAKSKKKGKIILAVFDAEPSFIQLIPKGVISVSGMQQPYRMGLEAMKLMDEHLHGRTVPKEVVLPVLTVTRENIQKYCKIIDSDVLGKCERKERP